VSDPESFEALRCGLLQLDPETRHQVIDAMLVMRSLPPPVAVRILAAASRSAADARRPFLVTLA
jgi:hypothetical protein